MYYIELAGTCVSELTVMNEVTINHQNSTVVLSSKYRAKTLYDNIYQSYSYISTNHTHTYISTNHTHTYLPITLIHTYLPII